MIDRMLLMFLGLLVAFVIAFRMFMPDVFGPAAKRDLLKHNRVMAYLGISGAAVYTMMAVSGEPAGWIIAAIFFAQGTMAWGRVRRVASIHALD